MSKILTIQPDGRQIELGEDETILAAALRANFNMPYGCRNGSCGACKGRVLSGQVEHDDHSLSALSEAERENGLALFCCAHPLGDAVVECREVDAIRDIPTKTLPARVEKINKVSHDVVVLSLRLPPSEKFLFLAGQYIDIHTSNGKKRSFSLANAPQDAGLLELHIRHAGGEYSGYVWNTMKEREILRFTGPLGSFFLREDTQKPIILIATGTGFAPIKGMLEQAFAKGIERKIVLYWGARNLGEIYMPDLPKGWQSEHANFSFIPVLSDPLEQDRWTGRTGLVHEAVLEDFGNFAPYQVYACGAPVMVEAAHEALTARGLPRDEFYSDAFFASKDARKP
ncbi:MAG: CDP-6-deoxy-delta-3,4-glucoseen reductase [Formivibrio sp.]|nr:CDP-6-deoxy-delta-3,4-glucoseen reductase [Formivibrio sp.]